MGTISKNFSYREFEASETADRLGIVNAITEVPVRNAIHNLVTKTLQPLRDSLGRPLHINSGYRCPALNKAVGGAATSQHTKGEAADIQTGSVEASHALATAVLRLGLPFDQMILYPTFVHLSLRLDGSQRSQVLYNKTYKGPKV